MVAQTVTKPAVGQKVKKDPVAPAVKITSDLKRAAISGRISKSELEAIGNLSIALQTFMGV